MMILILKMLLFKILNYRSMDHKIILKSMIKAFKKLIIFLKVIKIIDQVEINNKKEMKKIKNMLNYIMQMIRNKIKDIKASKKLLS